MRDEQKEIAHVLSEMGLDEQLIKAMTDVNQHREALTSLKK